MAVNTKAYIIGFPEPIGESGVGPPAQAGGAGLFPENMPVILCGQGTPDGDREPFLSANKGSLYLMTNATDDASHIYQKVDEGGDNDDWLIVPAS